MNNSSYLKQNEQPVFRENLSSNSEESLDKLMQVEVVHLIRRINNSMGAEKVAHNLVESMRALNVSCRAITANDLGWPIKAFHCSFYLRKLLLFVEVNFYTLASAIYVIFNRDANRVYISHNDALYSDIYINHGLHKRMWKQRSDRWIMLLRNPLHIVLIFREALRHRLCCYRYIVSFSDSDKRDLVEEYSVESDKISLISNGLDLKQFRPPCDMERKELRQHFRIGNRCCLLFVGQEFNRKGLRYAIEALRLLPQEYMMLVAGRDERERRRYEHEFQDLIESGRLEFLGFVNNIHQLYHAVDIFVLPTVYETWALVGLEAMASGIPVLITSVNGVNEYLQPGFNGYCIERDANDIATKVRAVTETPAKYEHMAKGALATARKYDWFAITYKYLDLVRKVMTDQRKRNK